MRTTTQLARQAVLFGNLTGMKCKNKPDKERERGGKWLTYVSLKWWSALPGIHEGLWSALVYCAGYFVINEVSNFASLKRAFVPLFRAPMSLAVPACCVLSQNVSLSLSGSEFLNKLRLITEPSMPIHSTWKLSKPSAPRETAWRFYRRCDASTR